MSKILFDLTKIQPVNGSKFHGGGKYGSIVFKKLAELAPDEIAGYYDDTRYIDQSIITICQEKNIPLSKKSECDVLTVAKRYDNILYSPLMDPAYLKDPSVNIIVTIHGLRVLEMPDDKYEFSYKKTSPLRRLLQKSILFEIFARKKRKNDFKKNLAQKRALLTNKQLKFITVSNHSKYSLLSFIPSFKENDITVFYSPSTINDEISTEHYQNPYGKYYMIVSGDRWLKNGLRSIRALDELFTERPEIKGNVVVTGLDKLSKLALSIKNPNRFVCLGYVDEPKLKALYQHAYLLLYPSLNEGFGYPPLEAMHEGTPVITSAFASIQEVCGDAVLYVNPYSVPEIKTRILQMENALFRRPAR